MEGFCSSLTCFCSKVNKISIHSVKYTCNIICCKAQGVTLRHMSVGHIRDSDCNHIAHKVHSEFETSRVQTIPVFLGRSVKTQRCSSPHRSWAFGWRVRTPAQQGGPRHWFPCATKHCPSADINCLLSAKEFDGPNIELYNELAF